MRPAVVGALAFVVAFTLVTSTSCDSLTYQEARRLCMTHGMLYVDHAGPSVLCRNQAGHWIKFALGSDE